MKQKGNNEFAKFNLYAPILKALDKKGYKQATPIQRKVIPELLEKRDVVGMARTGSGKTGAFVIPLLHHLKAHSAKVGARAVILCPSRELAYQTRTYIDKLAIGTDIRTMVIVGGENIQEQFTELLKNPDILIATPGRLLQLTDEMAAIKNKNNSETAENSQISSSFKQIEWLIFDEADILFELGLAPQIYSLIAKMPTDRVTALFSATLPKAIVELAKAGFKDPLLVRLDSEALLSPSLEPFFIYCQSAEKEATLFTLLCDSSSPIYIDPHSKLDNSNDEPFGGLIFSATRHHVEYLHELFTLMNIPHGSLYGTMDPIARNEALKAFKNKEFPLLLVTDVAARGLDIPFLKWILHFDFPPQEKLFVHRAGRVARAGRHGIAISLVTPDDLPYLFDLSAFLNKNLLVAGPSVTAQHSGTFFIGSIPKPLTDIYLEKITQLISSEIALSNLKGVILNALKLYNKTKPAASKLGFDKSKQLLHETRGVMSIHELWKDKITEAQNSSMEFLHQLKQWKPNQTIFEAMMKNTKGSKMDPAVSLISKRRSTLEKRKNKESLEQIEEIPSVIITESSRHIDEEVDEFELKKTFQIKQKEKSGDEFYLSYQPGSHSFDNPLKLNKNNTSSFIKEAAAISLDLVPKSKESLLVSSGPKMVWDKKHKKFVQVFPNQLKPESGSSFHRSIEELNNKSKKRPVGELYQSWKKRFKCDIPASGQSEFSSDKLRDLDLAKKIDYRGKKKSNNPNKQQKEDKQTTTMKKPFGKPKSELKSTEQLLRGRRIKANKMKHLAARKSKKNTKKQK